MKPLKAMKVMTAGAFGGFLFLAGLTLLAWRAMECPMCFDEGDYPACSTCGKGYARPET